MIQRLSPGTNSRYIIISSSFLPQALVGEAAQYTSSGKVYERKVHSVQVGATNKVDTLCG